MYSTNYPEDYNNNEDCGLLIESGVGNIVLEIRDFTTEGAEYDYVNIYDGANKQAELLATYRGKPHLGSIRSTGPYVYIEYITDSSYTMKGFHMRFKIAG